MKHLLTLLLLCCGALALAQKGIDNRQREIVFRNVTVMPMDKEGVLEKRIVVVYNGRVKAIGDAKTKYSSSALVIDGTGKYLMPGLAEMHAHVPPVDDLEPAREALLLFAANGVTGIRGMLGHPRHLELRSKIASGEIIGPRLYTSGPSFNGNSVSTPEAGTQMVRQQKAAGYDFLKMHPGLSVEKFAAIAAAAKQAGIPFGGHVSYTVGVQRAIDAGYATIDHMDGFVEALVPDLSAIPEGEAGLFGMFLMDKIDTIKIQPLIAALQKSNTWIVPTQALAERWMSPDRTTDALRAEPEMQYISTTTLANWAAAKNNIAKNSSYNPDDVNRYIALRRKLIKACADAGVGLLLGSDAPQVFNVPGFSLHHELQYLVDAGLTPYEALRTGTVNVGTFFAQPDRGVIKPGAVADLILLAANPLINIANTRQIEGVMLHTQWLDKSWIDSTLKSLQKH